MSNELPAPQPSADSASEPASDPNPSGRPLWLQIVFGLFMAIAGLVLVAFLISLLLPSAFVVTRSVVISASPSEIHPYVNSLSQWPHWTAWNTDNYPELKYTYEGPEAGVGAIQTWTEPGMGGGRLEITRSEEGTGVEFTLKFEQSPEPLVGSIEYNVVKGVSDGDADVTRVTWTGHGELGANPIARYFGLLMDSMIGTDYETGLKNLKILVEAPPAE